MSAARLSFSRQALAAVAVFAAILFAVILWGAAYLVTMRDLQAEFATKSQILDVLKRQTQQRLAGRSRQTQPITRDGVISAPTETVAASELDKAIIRALESAGGVIRSIQAEATSDVTSDGLRRLNAQVTFDGSIDALQKVLFEVETAVPFIFVDSLLVQPTTSESSAKAGEALRVNLAASSFWKRFEADTNDAAAAPTSR
jgi:general secretion pathway protein M